MADYTFKKVCTSSILTNANLQMWNFPQIQLAKKRYDLLEFVHQEGNNVSLKFGQPSLVYQETNQELEDDFRTLGCIFGDPMPSQRSCSKKTLNKEPSKKKIIKLQKTASVTSPEPD